VHQVLGYVPSTDEHVPVLTVEETLRYLYFTRVLGLF
jgi:ABC-type multidrug transport system ATPase subunit